VTGTEESLVGSSFGRWTVARRLGEGAMGPVFEGVSTGGTRGALHLIRPELVAGERFEGFQRAARSFQKVEHPSVPRLLDVDEAQGRLFLAFELVEGRSLQYRLDRKESLTPAEGRNFATDLLSALAVVHERAIIHGDVKPASVLLGPEGCWKLTGFSVGPRESAGPASADGVVRGTPLFMSPELSEGEAPSIASDLYSAGATIFAAIAGEAPFLRPSVAAILDAHKNDAPPKLADKVPAVEKDLAELVASLLAKVPSKRPADARAALAALGAKTSRQARAKTQQAIQVVVAGEETPPTSPPADAAGPAGAPSVPGRPRSLTETTHRRAIAAVELERGQAVADVDPEIARTALARAPLRLQAWWHQRRGRLKRAALAESKLGNFATAGELLLDSGEPILGAQFFLRAGIPHAAAIIFEKIGDFVSAIDAYAAAGKLDEATKLASQHGLFEEAGRAFERAGQLEQAVEAYGRAGKQLLLAVVYERLGNLLEAAHAYEEANELPKAAQIYERLGRVADAVRIYERAGDIARIAAAWEAAGDAKAAARWRAERELAEGRHGNAAREFERAGLPGRAADIFLAQNLVTDAVRCAESTGDAARTAALYARTGDFAKAAASYVKAGQHREAARCFHELGQVPDEAASLERAGEALRAAEVWLVASRPDDARRVLAAVPKESPDRKRARARLGELEASAGRSRAAADAFVEAIEGTEPTAENVMNFVDGADALAACDELDRAIELLSRLKGLKFAPPTLGMFLTELERKREASAPRNAGSRGEAELVGVELDRYKTLSYSGEGDLSWGYEAMHTLLKRTADLRVLKPTVEPDRAKRFFAEGRSLALARHPNLQDVYDSGTTASGVSYVALELSRDPSLRQLLRGPLGAFPVPRAAAIGAGMLAGLGSAHRAGIAHGDLRPENVLVAPGDRPTITGFPFARHGGKLMTRRQAVAAAYTAPEQTPGAEPTAAADQYAAAVILYEMLAGQHPIEPGSDALRPLAQVAPSIPAELAAAVMKALDQDPARRHADVGAFGKVVARFATS
jgi:serine/threonine protein kinase